MKKLIFIVTLLLAFGFSGWWVMRPAPAVSPPTPKPIQKTVRLSIIGHPDSPLTYALNLDASASALTLLQNATQKAGLSLEIKKYSFGTLVESVNGLKNTSDKAWIYFVNGKSASVGADQYQVQPGDLIEWKYVKPQY